MFGGSETRVSGRWDKRERDRNGEKQEGTGDRKRKRKGRKFKKWCCLRRKVEKTELSIGNETFTVYSP